MSDQAWRVDQRPSSRHALYLRELRAMREELTKFPMEEVETRVLILEMVDLLRALIRKVE